jgi:uncharacterized membrane protein
MPKLQLKVLYQKAFAIYKLHWKFLVIITFGSSLIQYGLNFLTNQFTQPALAIPSSLISLAINTTITVGLINVYLKLHDTNMANYPDLYSKLNLVGKTILANLLYGLIITVGIILLIVPGLIFAIKYLFFSFLVVDKGLNPIEALKQSGRITKGHRWQLLLLALSMALLNLLGTLLVFVGLLFTLPISMLVMTQAYRQLNVKPVPTQASAE